MSRVHGLAERFEFLLDWGNDLTSVWGPFRRWLPPEDVRLQGPFVVLWTVAAALAASFGTLAAVTLIYMIAARPTWSPAVAAGRLPISSVVTYYAGWVMHRSGFLLFYLAPALVVALNGITIGAWNLRARRLQREGPPQEAGTALGDGVWPPPPANRK